MSREGPAKLVNVRRASLVGGVAQTHLAVVDLRAGVEDGGVVDDLQVTRLQRQRQVKARVLCQGCHRPVNAITCLDEHCRDPQYR